MPLGYALAGPLADRVFSPLLMPGGALAGTVGAVLGIGEGRGIGLMFITAGGLYVAFSCMGLAYPRLRNLAK